MDVLQALTSQVDIGGIWRIGFVVVGAIALYFFMEGYGKKIGWAATGLWFYTLTYCLYLVEYPKLHFGLANTAYQASAGATFISVLLLGWFAVNHPRIIKSALPYILLIECLLLSFGGDGLMSARSFDLAFLALCVPIAGLGLAIWSVVLILINHGATAQLILIAQLFAVALKYKRFRPYFLTGVIVLVTVAYLHSYGAYFDGGERLHKWRQMLSIWKSSGSYVLFGVGPGTFTWQSMAADNWVQPSYKYFLWMHSDWLQILFELGLVGFTLAVATFYRAVKLAWSKPRLLAAVFGAAAFGLTYYPLHFALSAVVVGMIFSWALSKTKVSS